MTSAESTLLGIGIGALLTWLSSAIQSRWQWKREERRRRAERRADVYREILLEVHQYMEPHRRSQPSSVGTVDDFRKSMLETSVSVDLFASNDVQTLWRTWSVDYLELWKTPPTSADEGKAWHDNVTKIQGALMAGMRAELSH